MRKINEGKAGRRETERKKKGLDAYIVEWKYDHMWSWPGIAPDTVNSFLRRI